jgi:hypothetical protein
MTEWPLTAKDWAMLLPITPEPMMVIFSTKPIHLSFS